MPIRSSVSFESSNKRCKYITVTFLSHRIRCAAMQCNAYGNASGVKGPLVSLPSGREAGYCDVCGVPVCMYMYLSLCSMHISKTTCPNFTEFYVHVTNGRRSVFFPLAALRYVMYFRMWMTYVSTQWPGGICDAKIAYRLLHMDDTAAYAKSDSTGASVRLRETQ